MFYPVPHGCSSHVAQLSSTHQLYTLVTLPYTVNTFYQWKLSQARTKEQQHAPFYNDSNWSSSRQEMCD